MKYQKISRTDDYTSLDEEIIMPAFENVTDGVTGNFYYAHARVSNGTGYLWASNIRMNISQAAPFEFTAVFSK